MIETNYLYEAKKLLIIAEKEVQIILVLAEKRNE